MKKTVTARARIAEPIAEKANQVAKSQGLNLSEFVRNAIVEKIQRDGEKLCS